MSISKCHHEPNKCCSKCQLSLWRSVDDCRCSCHCIGRRAGCKCDLHMFQDATDKEVIESTLYTDDGMFGDIQFEAEDELKFRFPKPMWAIEKLGNNVACPCGCQSHKIHLRCNPEGCFCDHEIHNPDDCSCDTGWAGCA